MNYTKANINNLTNLWKIAGKTQQGFTEHSEYFVSQIENSDWPNRVWLKGKATETSIEHIEKELNGPLSFSFFNCTQKSMSQKKQDKLVLKSIQYGMSMPLNSKFKPNLQLRLQKVENKRDAALWSSTFYKAFNYRIAEEIILKTIEDIHYCLVYYKEEIVGTIILYFSSLVAGIHSLGILPEHRKKGYALQAMYHALNKSIEQNCTIATLQASEMAKKMYKKIGFILDFQMENYILNKSD